MTPDVLVGLLAEPAPDAGFRRRRARRGDSGRRREPHRADCCVRWSKRCVASPTAAWSPADGRWSRTSTCSRRPPAASAPARRRMSRSTPTGPGRRAARVPGRRAAGLDPGRPRQAPDRARAHRGRLRARRALPRARGRRDPAGLAPRPRRAAPLPGRRGAARPRRRRVLAHRRPGRRSADRVSVPDARIRLRSRVVRRAQSAVPRAGPGGQQPAVRGEPARVAPPAATRRPARSRRSGPVWSQLGGQFDGRLDQVREAVQQVVRVHVREAEAADPGRVDDPAERRVGQRRQRAHRAGRGVPALADRADHADRPVGVRDEPVDQRRLAHAGVPDQDREPVGAARPRSASGRTVRPAQHVRQLQLGVVAEHRPPARPGRPWSGRAAARCPRRTRRPGSGR